MSLILAIRNSITESSIMSTKSVHRSPISRPRHLRSSLSLSNLDLVSILGKCPPQSTDGRGHPRLVLYILLGCLPQHSYKRHCCSLLVQTTERNCFSYSNQIYFINPVIHLCQVFFKTFQRRCLLFFFVPSSPTCRICETPPRPPWETRLF